MMSATFRHLALPLVLVAGLSACRRQSAARTDVDAGALFQAEPPEVYVAKVKGLLVGLAPTEEEMAAVRADPHALAGLIDRWMATPEYQEKMRVFFELAFQQTQIGTADFTEMIPPSGLGVGRQIPLLLQNLRESFARTALALVEEGRPITEAFTTHRLMMTPALMELYAFLDVRHVDDAAKVTDAFAKANPKLTLTVEAAQGPIPVAESIDPTSPHYMHWYNPNVGTLNYPDAGCNVDPIVLPATAYGLHLLLYGGIFQHKVDQVGCNTRSTTGYQLEPSDFSTWKMVTLRAPKAGEAVTRFYDLPLLRTSQELVLATPRVGFFSTPAFGANWPTNSSNQMRVTINQILIVATGMAIDGTDKTVPAMTPGLDAEHSVPGSACFGCHQLLDPTRAILTSTYSYYYYPQSNPAAVQQKGLFAFQGVVTPVSTLDDLARTLATHPAVPAAWVQKLCYWANSASCVADDPEFQHLVSDFQQSNFSWSMLVRELMASPLVTHAAPTLTARTQGEVVAVTRRDHLCANLNNRLGLVDVCGLDDTRKRQSPLVAQIVGGLPSDGYGRGSPIPVLPNEPSLFYRAGLENICAAVAALVVDAKSNPDLPNAKHWSSAQPDAAIGDFVATVMALTPSDPRSSKATALLRAHFDAAKSSGASATNALRSTFVAACLAPSAIGIGM